MFLVCKCGQSITEDDLLWAGEEMCKACREFLLEDRQSREELNKNDWNKF
jgi:hypothetical protein